ncbi:hypothetical protein EDC96DRAFT_42102 [Choanephora cucurbitarum]|nr:hypothetical protein EDC96DRAFT_42102 [Choanephora cucurbitarum]
MFGCHVRQNAFPPPIGFNTKELDAWYESVQKRSKTESAFVRLKTNRHFFFLGFLYLEVLAFISVYYFTQENRNLADQVLGFVVEEKLFEAGTYIKYFFEQSAFTPFSTSWLCSGSVGIMHLQVFYFF